MKKFLLVIIVFLLSTGQTFTQTSDATLAIDDVNIINLPVGDDVIVPVRLESMDPPTLIIGLEFLIEFDHNILTWKGTMANPLPGVENFNPVMPYSPADWMFFINPDMNVLSMSWTDPTFYGVNVDEGDQFFDLIFTYNGGLSVGDSSFIVFQEGTSLGPLFELTFNNGSVYIANEVNIPEFDDNSIKIWSYEQKINVIISEATNGYMAVYNMTGQEIIRSEIKQGINVIPVNEPNTFYIVKVLTDNKTITEKIFIK